MTSKFHYRFPERFVTHLEGTQLAADLYSEDGPLLARRSASGEYKGYSLDAINALLKVRQGSTHKDGSVHVRVSLTDEETLWLVDQAEMLEMCGSQLLGDTPMAQLEGMADIRSARAAIRSLNKGYWRS